MKRIAIITAAALTLGLAVVGCGSSGGNTAQSARSGFYNPTTLQNEIKRESVGRDELTWVSCIIAGSQEAKCNATDTSGTSMSMTVTINAAGDHYLITNIRTAP